MVMENHLVVLLLSVVILIGAFYGYTVEQKIFQIKNDLEEVKDDLESTKQELKQLKVELKAMHTELTEVKVDLESSRKEHKEVNEELESTKKEVTKVKVELESNKNEVKQVELELGSTRKELKQVNVELESKKKEVKQVKVELDTTKKEVKQVKAELDKIKTGMQDQCSYGWKRFNNHCYMFRYDRLTWQQAKHECENYKAYLVKIETSKENRWIGNEITISASSSHDQIWTGLNDLLSEGHFTWVFDHSSVDFSNWLRGEPNNGNGYENCGSIHTNGQSTWNDAKCAYKTGYICEK